jgi:dynamin 1-like protein
MGYYLAMFLIYPWILFVRSGTDVREYLLGEKAPRLRLGYVAVVNRSQADINSQIPVGIALKAEQEWFETSERGQAAYADIASSCCTTRVLAHKINALLKSHIQQLIPNLQDDLRSQVSRLLRFSLSWKHVRR